MTCRPAEAPDAEMQALYREDLRVEWMDELALHPRWFPGRSERPIFATLPCAPWRWVLVAPCEQAPQGCVDVATGKFQPIVW